jgi:hypothetical protein
MRSVAVLLIVALLSACAPKEEAPPPPPAAPTVADFAGTWNMAVVLEGNPDTVPSTLTGSADGSTWTMSLEGRPSIPVTVSMVGDSLVGMSAEYESILRAGVMVTVRTASVMSNGALVGTVVATYKTPTGEQVVNGTLTGTKGM